MKITSVAELNTFSNPHNVSAKKIFESPQATVFIWLLIPERA
jgi:hypothetical protein